MSFNLLTRRAHFSRKLILSGALVLSLHQGLGQCYDFSPDCEKALQSILQFRLDEAGMLLQHEKATNPGNLFPYYIENYIDFF